MTLKNVNDKTVREVSNSELMNLHYRVHQLYSLSKKKNTGSKEFRRFLVECHTILEREMTRRKLKHKTPLLESFLEVFLDNLFNGDINE